MIVDCHAAVNTFCPQIATNYILTICVNEHIGEEALCLPHTNDMNNIRYTRYLPSQYTPRKDTCRRCGEPIQEMLILEINRITVKHILQYLRHAPAYGPHIFQADNPV